jgi:hypothetical protein
MVVSGNVQTEGNHKTFCPAEFQIGHLSNIVLILAHILVATCLAYVTYK